MEERMVRSADEMMALGQEIGHGVGPGAMIALVGDLGAGKTHFTKGVAQALAGGEVSSPTFTLVNEVPLRGEMALYHFDFYRVGQVDELYDLGWDDYLERGGVVIAEWADLYPELVPVTALWIKIEHVPEGRRVLIKHP